MIALAIHLFTLACASFAAGVLYSETRRALPYVQRLRQLSRIMREGEI